MDPIRHSTCVGHDEGEVEAVLTRYAKAGISNIMTLRGDVPKSGGTDAWRSFRYAAQLVRFIKQFNARGIHADKRGFGIGVAGYPEGHAETPNRLVEMDRLKAKVEECCGLHRSRNFFFDNRDFFDFRSRCELAGIKVPIIAGIMPITSPQGT